MSKKMLIAILSISLIVSNSAFSVWADDDKNISIKDETLYLYPIFGGGFKTEFTSESMVNNVIPLDESENAITVSLTEIKENEIYVMSVYDVTDMKYITSNKGVAVTGEKFTIKGLTGGHDYKVRACSLFNETSVNGTITTGYIE